MISGMIKIALAVLAIIVTTLFLGFTCPGHRVIGALGIETAWFPRNC